MVKRNSGSFTLAYDSENRLTTVSGGASATFVYDGDGNRVKGTVGATTTSYVGNYFEWTGNTSTMVKYYYHGGKRVAMRVGTSTWYFLLTDHLTSTAITATSAGSKSAELRYKAWGENRYSSGTTPTTYRFTGQREESTIGLYFYNARWYDAALSRFAQADTIVPEPGNPQALNRYAYTYNNPMRYIDPTGHFTDEELLKWRVFYGPNQVAGTRDHPAPGSPIAAWYYLLRAAEFGDTVSFEMEGNWLTGQFHLGNGGLQFTAAGGREYQATYAGFRSGGSDSSFLPIQTSLEKSDGATLRGLEQYRRYVRRAETGDHPLTEADYCNFSFGGYFILGGHVSVKRDRYERWYIGLNVGLGVGKFGFSITQGNLVQDYSPDPGQLTQTIAGWGVSLQGGYHSGGGISVVDIGPTPVEYGYSSPGISGSVGCTWRVR